MTPVHNRGLFTFSLLERLPDGDGCSLTNILETRVTGKRMAYNPNAIN